MNDETKTKMKILLTQKIEEIWNSDDLPDKLLSSLPWLGENISSIMATAALAVLEGMADGEIYMQENGYLKD